MGLGRLLDALTRLQFKDNNPDIFHVIVVDNDGDGSAPAICAPYDRIWPGRLHFLIEPRKGICSARNQALRRATELNCGLVAFIDDDGTPEPGWLDAAIRAMRRYGADAVHGLILRRFDQAPPEWILRGGFFKSPDWESGKPLSFGNTANLLARREIFDALGGFDTAFDLTGGGDDHLFHRAARRGYKIIYCREAVVLEFIPPDRTTIRWILRRNFRIGSNWGRALLKIDPGVRVRLALAAQGLVRMAAAAPLLCAGLVSKPAVVHACALFLRGLGRWAALAGFRFKEYDQTL